MIKKVIHAKWIKILSGVAHPFFFYIYIYIYIAGGKISSARKRLCSNKKRKRNTHFNSFIEVDSKSKEWEETRREKRER